MRPLMKTVFPLLFLLVLLSACSAFRQPLPPQVELSSLTVEDVSLTHANLLARLRLYNPNAFGATVEGVRLKLSLNNVHMANGGGVGPVELVANGYGELPVRVSVPLWAFFNLAQSLPNSKQVRFDLTGDVQLGGFGIMGGNFPLEKSGTIPLAGIDGKNLFAPRNN